MRYLVLVFLAALFTPQTLAPFRIPVAVGGGSTFSQPDFTYLGFFEVPSGGNPTTGSEPNSGAGDPEIMGFNDVGGVEHVMLVQASNHGDFSNVGYGALYEFTDPGSGYTNNIGTAPHGTFVRNWGKTAGGAFYDMWGGNLGRTKCYTNTAWTDPVTHTTCTPGTSGIKVGDAGTGDSNYVPIGLHFHDDGSGNCCWMISYSQGYSNYSPDDSVLIAKLSGAGSVTTNGPLRYCVGQYGVDGAGGDTCGPMRALHFFDSPDGTMGFAGGIGPWQQNTDNKGPAIFWGNAWPTMSTDASYGSTRGGDASKRTTDGLPTTKALSFTTLDNSINCDGSIIGGGPNATFRRPADGTLGNYRYENAGLCAAEEIDPSLYGGVGSWNGVDQLDAGVYINTSPKSGFMSLMNLNMGDTWYKTQAGFTYQEKGVGPVLIFQRNADEATACSVYADYNANVFLNVKPAFYTNVVANAVSIQFLNPGTPNASRSVTHSGNAITVHLATNGSSQVTTTANDIVTAISGDSFANTAIAASIPAYPNCLIPLGVSSTGNGTVDTITNPTLNNGGGASAMLSGGFLTPAAGPQWCPLHNIASPFTVTGPTSTKSAEPAIAVYSTSKIQAAPGSGNHDYSLDPESIIYLHNIDATMKFGRGNNDGISVSGIGWNPEHNKLYIGAPYIDDQTYVGCCSKMPVVHVFTLATSMPTPADVLINILKVYVAPKLNAFKDSVFGPPTFIQALGK